MGWVRVSDDFYDHDKFTRLTVLGDAVWIRGLAYANRNLTDGVISERAARGLVETRGIAINLGMGGRDAEPQDGIDELLDAGIWHQPGHTCDVCPQPPARSYYIHDYLRYQPSKQQVRDKQAATTERVRKHRDASNTTRNAVTNAASNGVGTTPPKSQVPTPIPTSKNQSSPSGGAGGNGPDELTTRAARYRCDGPAIRRHLAKVLTEIPDDDTVLQVIVSILAKAKQPPEKPTNYVIGSIRRNEFEIQQLVYGYREDSA